MENMQCFWKFTESIYVEWIQCELVNIPGHIVQLETQIYELKKGQQNSKNKTKLESLKEMVKLNFAKPNHIIPD